MGPAPDQGTCSKADTHSIHANMLGWRHANMLGWRAHSAQQACIAYVIDNIARLLLTKFEGWLGKDRPTIQKNLSALTKRRD